MLNNVYQPPIEFIIYIHPKAHKELSNIPLDDIFNKRKRVAYMEIKRAQEETDFFDEIIVKNSNSMQKT